MDKNDFLFAVTWAVICFFLVVSPRAEAEPVEADDRYVLACKNAEEAYFIRPSGIVYVMQGLGVSNCFIAIDTTGKKRTLCKNEESLDSCEILRAGPEA